MSKSKDRPLEILASFADQQTARADQLSYNCSWLVGKIDQIHEALCPGRTGTWQARAEQAVLAAQDIAAQRAIQSKKIDD